jgi:hypothetical protein
MRSELKEARIILVIEVIKMRYIKSYREVARIYNISELILYIKMIGKSIFVEY